MRKNVFKSLLAMCAFAATFTACSNENNEVPNVDQKDSKSVFMKLELPAVTKAVGPAVTGAAQVNNLSIYFHDGTNIVKFVSVTSSTTPSLAALTTGAQIADVPATATQVTIYANVPAAVGLPIAGTLASVKAKEVDMVSQNVITNVVLKSADENLTTFSGGTPPVWATGIQNNDKYASVEIAPAVARVEIEGIQTSSTKIATFTLKGIYLNNFSEKFSLAGTSSALVNYGATAAAYAQGQGLYTPANSGILYDEMTTAASGSPLAVEAGASNFWTYQVAPNAGTTANSQLQIVFKMDNVTATALSGITFPAGDLFLTVRGFKDAVTDALLTIEPGKIYTISKSNFDFNETHLNPIPNTNAVGVWLKVTVKNWVVVPVKPNL